MFAEAVTLAHVARPVALARSLDPAQYEVVMACAPRYAAFATDERWCLLGLNSISGEQFAKALTQGSPLYDLATLETYVMDDLALIERVNPDLVVGDFRLSLSVSARLARVPYLAIANAYWSQYSLAPFPLPVLPITRVLPLGLASVLFSAFRPLAFALHCRPMNRLRVRHGLPELGSDLRRVYSDADHLLVPDIESLYPLDAAPGSAKPFSHVGPLSWSPPVPWPADWHVSAADLRAAVYVTLGSSGPKDALALVLAALDGLPLRVMASSAGAPSPAYIPNNAKVAPYLPGDQAAARADLVVCNGGSLATQQALAAGVPILGLATNMDQFLNMAPLVAAGAGQLLRTDRLNVAGVRQACQALLQSPVAKAAALHLQPLLTPACTAGQVFDRVARGLVAGAVAQAQSPAWRSEVPGTKQLQ